MHGKWLLLSVKQNLKSITFWMLTVSFLLLLFMLRYLTLAHEGTNRVLVYTGGSEKAEAVMSALEADEYQGFDFERTQSIEDLKEAVYRSEALAGVVFTDRFEQSVKTGETDGQVILYSTPDTAANVLLKELLFPCILQTESPALLSAYLKSRSAFDTAEADRFVIEKNNALTGTWNLQLFAVEEVPMTASGPVRSLPYALLLFILLHLAVFVLTVFEEKKIHKGFLSSVAKADEIRFVMESAMARTVLLALCLIAANALIGLGLF